MAKVIIVTFGKSDVGSTTSTGALSAALALQGWHGGVAARAELPAVGEGEAAAKRL